MWMKGGIKVDPFDLMETAEGLSQLVAGFLRKGRDRTQACLSAGDDDIASRLAEVTRAAEELARLVRLVADGGPEGKEIDLGDMRSRFFQLIVRADSILRDWLGRGGGRELSRSLM